METFADDEIFDISGQYHEGIGVGYELSPNLKEVDLTNTRCRKIENLHILLCLKKLTLRQNLISKIENLDDETIQFRNTLEYLDLYDNSIEKVEGINNLTSLTHLDLSFNKIRVIEGIENLKKLVDIYFVNNKIKAIPPGVFTGENFPNLTTLELGSNRIREIAHIDGLKNLKYLWLGKNKITQLKNLQGLVNLKILSVQSNRLSKIEGLETLVNLEELYLSSNGISVIEGLDNLVHLLQTPLNNLILGQKSLRILDLSANPIQRLTGLSHLVTLREFWFNDNQLAHFEDVIKEFSQCHELDTVFFGGNPISRDPQYRNKMIAALPSLTCIDSIDVVKSSLTAALRGTEK